MPTIIRTNTTFRCFLSLGSTGRQEFIEIEEGTYGITSDDGEKVVFEYAKGDTAEGSIYHGERSTNDATLVYKRFLDYSK